jgi:hypothetical protein
MIKQITLGLGLAALAATAFAFFAPTSGLKAGESISAFHPKHVAGPLANSEKCFPCTFQSRPQVQVWVNGDNLENVAKIAKALQTATETHKSKELKTMVVFLAKPEKQAALTATIKTAAKETGAKDVAMALLDPSDEAISAYKINTAADVKNTVIVYRNWKVTASMTNLKADDAGKSALMAAIANATK